ncbi:MAG: hypothetical protein ACJAVF_002491, partial [Paraglaciecola sp.]
RRRRRAWSLEGENSFYNDFSPSNSLRLGAFYFIKNLLSFQF